MAQKNKKKKKTRKSKLVQEEDKDFSQPQCLVTLANFLPANTLCDHKAEVLELVSVMPSM